MRVFVSGETAPAKSGAIWELRSRVRVDPTGPDGVPEPHDRAAQHPAADARMRTETIYVDEGFEKGVSSDELYCFVQKNALSHGHQEDQIERTLLLCV